MNFVIEGTDDFSSEKNIKEHCQNIRGFRKIF